MRIVFDSFESFLQEIAEQAEAVRGKTVRFIIARMPEQDAGVSFQVGFMATAVANDGDGGTLLEVAIQCGKDEAAQKSRGEIVVPEKTSGSDGAAKLAAMLKAACEKSGLKMRPGKIELF